MSARPALRRPSLGTWAAVVTCLVLLDLLLFRVGLLWKLTPDFGPGMGGANWHMLYTAARAFESEPAAPDKAVMVGSSVVLYGTDVAAINAQLKGDGLPVELARFVTHGSTATDSALLVWNAKALHPWLAIYGIAARDFPKVGPTDSGVAEPSTIRPSSSPPFPAGHRGQARRLRQALLEALSVPLLHADGVREHLHALDAQARAADARARGPGAGSAAHPHGNRPLLPARSHHRRFLAAWDRWRQSRQFSDYLAWMSYSGGLTTALYKTQTVANFGPQDNPHAAALSWMLADLKREGTRALLLYFPENPIFRAPEAREYFDPALSDGYAALLRREAAANGARFEDLRNFLQPEDFYDLIHANLEGQRKLSARIAELVAEEWRARQQVDK